MFARLRAPGLWTLSSTVDPAEWEAFDDHQSKAIDGAGGGAYALTADMVIGGAPGVGWTFDLPVEFDDDALFSGGNFEVYAGSIVLGADSADALAVHANTSLVGNSTTIGASGADALIVESFATFYDIAAFQGQSFFYAPTDFGDDVDFHDGTVTMGASGADAFTVNAFTQFNDIAGFAGSTYFYSTVSLQGVMTSSGSGYAQVRKVSRQAIGGDADASYAPTSYDHVHVPSGGVTATRSYTIDDTGAVNGDRMQFSTLDPNFAINVKNPGGTQIAQIKADTGGKMGVVVERIAGSWRILGLLVTPV